jgi:hypothetical protein
MNLEPAIGLEPMTCALRVRHPMSLRSRQLSHYAQNPNVFDSHPLRAPIAITRIDTTSALSCY